MISKYSTYPQSLSNFFNWVTIAIAILFGILCVLTPPGADDLLFLDGTVPTGNFSEMWNKLISACYLRWNTETGRLGVFMSLGFLYLLPKWVFGVLLAFAIYVLVHYICKIANLFPGSVLSWLTLAAIVFFAPWYDFMFLISYSMNYVIGGAVTVAAVFFFLNIEKYSGWRLAGIFVLMFASGWIHEGYSAPFGIAATVWMLRLRRFSWRTIISWIFLGAGAFIIALSPTLWHRAGGEMLILQFPIKEAILQLGPSLLFGLLFMIISCIAFHHKRIRKGTQQNAEWMFLMIYLVISLIILTVFYCGPRTGFPTIIFSIVGIAYILRLFIDTPQQMAPTLFVGVIIGLMIIAHLAYACLAEYQVRKEYYEIVERYKASDNGTFYYDQTYPHLDWSLYKTSVRDFHSREPMFMWENYYDPAKHLVILPTLMKGFSEEKAKISIYSTNIMIYNGQIVVKSEKNIPDVPKITIHTKGGKKIQSRYRIDDFRDENGITYNLIVPHAKILDQSLEISDVEF